MKKKNNRHRFIWLLIAITSVYFVTGCGGIFFPLPYRSLAPFKGKVVDADTKEPIEGAVVLAAYYFTSYGIAGSNSSVEDGQETLTDKNGEFKLPRTRRWFVLHRGYPEGTLEIFKPGYGLLADKRSKAIGDNKSWPTPGKFIVYELPRLKTIEERRKVRVYSYDEIQYEYRKFYFSAHNKERIFLGYEPLPIPK
jgi:hypothetical protein